MVGQSAVVEQVLVALVASGHVLIEGVPGLGKTLLVRALAQALSLAHARVQFTPDMMPSDITGHAVLDPSTRELRIVRGPVFTHVLLADEINRAPAKTQSALLEVMQEYQVTLEGQTHPAAEALHGAGHAEPGRDRRAPIRCPRRSSIASCSRSRSAIRRAPRRWPSSSRATDGPGRRRAAAGGREAVSRRRRACRSCSSSRRSSASTSRSSTTPCASRARRATWPGLAIGSGSRGALALVRGARAVALLDGRDYVTPDDVKRIALPALRHRVALAPDALLEGRTTNDLLAAVIETVAAPRV